MNKKKTTISNQTVELIATGFYSGWLPYAPGTWGSWIAACMVTPSVMLPFSGINYLALGMGVIWSILGFWSSTKIQVESNQKDPSFIVIDEFAGMAITYTLVPITITTFITGFLFFRFFDIVKPWPIYKLQKYPKAIGIMIDDLVAGIFSTFFTWTIYQLIT